MKIALLLAFFAGVFGVYAQPIIQNGSLIPAVGTTAPLLTGAPISGIEKSGADQVWDLSSVVFTNPDVIFTVVSPNSTPFASSFTASNYAWTFTVAGTVQYFYYNVSATKYEVLADGILAPGTGNDYSPDPKTNIQFPCKFGDTFQDTWQKSGGVSGSVTTTYDAYGTLILPFGTYKNVWRLKENKNGAISYAWHTTNPLLPILVYNLTNKSLVLFGNTVPALTVSSNQMSIASPANSTGALTITANTPWTAKCNQAWLTLSASGGSGNDVLTLTAQANTSTSPRVAMLTVAGVGVDSQVISVTQDAAGVTLGVSKQLLSILSPANSTASFAITSTTAWSVTSSEAWLLPNKSTGSGNDSITLTAQENTSVSPRIATVTVAGTGVASQVITITQAPAAAILVLSTSAVALLASANSTQSFTITSNTSWTVASSQPWLTPSLLSGTGNTEILLTATANPDTVKRVAILTVTAAGLTPQSVQASQDGMAASGIMEDGKHELPVALYPNPAHETLVIHILTRDMEAGLMLTLTNSIGQSIMEIPLTSSVTYLKTSMLPAGVYCFRIQRHLSVIQSGTVVVE